MEKRREENMENIEHAKEQVEIDEEKKIKETMQRTKNTKTSMFHGINSRQSEGLNDDKVKAFLCCLHFPNHIAVMRRISYLYYHIHD